MIGCGGEFFAGQYISVKGEISVFWCRDHVYGVRDLSSPLRSIYMFSWRKRSIADALMRFNKLIAVFLVGTEFIPSGDSSPCGISTPLPPVSISMQGDESPDGINSVPTRKTAINWLNRISWSLPQINR